MQWHEACRHAGISWTSSRLFLSAALLALVAGVASFAVLSAVASALSWLCLLPPALAIFLAWRLPFVWSRRRAEALEWQLSGLLRVLSVQLSFGDFERALADAIRTLERPAPALFALGADLRSGKSLSESLHAFSSRTPSLLAKKAAMHLMLCYQGGKSETLDALADECGSAHAARLQAFAGRSAFLALWFVVLGALVPLMLAAMALVGSAFLSFDVAPPVVLLFFAVGLPGALAGVVFFTAAIRPGGFS